MARTSLTNKSGANVSAVFGYFNTLLSIFKEYKPDYLIIAGDSRGGSFRNQIYPEYKSNRTEAPEELKTQFALIENGIKEANINYLSLQDYEADDIIASIVNKFSIEKDLDIYIYSMDKDFMQIVKENVFLLRSSRTNEKTIFDMQKILNEKGVETWQFVDYQAILGDAIDNVPGVKGIGKKGASNLLKKYKTLEGIYQNINELSSKQKKFLEESRDEAFLSKVLVTLKKDIQINLELDELKFNQIDFNSLRLFFANQGFKSLIKIILKDYQKEENLNLFNTDSKIRPNLNRVNVFEKIESEEEIYSFNLKIERIEEIFIHIYDDEFFIILYDKIYLIKCDLKILKNIFLSKKIISLNSKSIFKFLSKIDIEITPYFSLDIASYLLKSEAEMHDLEYLFYTYLGLQLHALSKETILGNLFLLYKTMQKEIEKENLEYLFYMIEIPLSKILAQMELEGILFDKIKLKSIEKELQKKIKKIEEDIYQEAFKKIKDAENEIKIKIEELIKISLRQEEIQRLTEEIVKKENTKLWNEIIEEIKISSDKLWNEVFNREKITPFFTEFRDKLLKVYQNPFETNLVEELNESYKNLAEIANEKFNILSSKQLQIILFEKRKLKTGKKTKTGHSTDIHVLSELAKDDLLSALILKYRTYKKLDSSYIKTLPKFAGEDSKIHTTFEQTKTATGRLASENPNIQNIPTNTEEFKLRDCFVTRPGYSFVSADYSQIELVIMAYYANDLHMIKTIKQGKDIHKQTAAKIFKIKENEVNSNFRNIAKAVNFGTIYGISAYGLALNLGINMASAKEFLQNYFNEFKAVELFLEKTLKESEKNCQVKTIFNRMREIKPSFNDSQKKLNQRLSVNSIIQGSSADIIKKAMVDIQKELKKKVENKIFIKGKTLKHKLKKLQIRSRKQKNYLKILKKIKYRGIKIKTNQIDAVLILQIHDELIFECKDKDINALKILLKKKMINLPSNLELERLLKINIKIGKTWGEL